MAIVYEKSKGLTDAELHYCPGCHHGIIHKLVAESLVELGLLDDAIGVCPVGCSVFAFKYFNCDMQEAAHGRAPAAATGIKRTHPHQAVFTYQGDGDLASIGAAEIVHAAMRGEKFTTIFVNNAIYGMTGGHHPDRPEGHHLPGGPHQGTGRYAHPHGGAAVHPGRLCLCRAGLRH